MSPEMAGCIRQSVEDGEYASTSEVVRQACQKMESQAHQLMLSELIELKADPTFNVYYS
ncbi:type II toxin-antitoxin system ParD family antitoxin [Burkholderia anthina]|uniref:ribbon-helix-helix domain-containing protein n=1 Tax=Burkholderia anthina TaxID=179879 RepID=UPI00158EF6F8